MESPPEKTLKGANQHQGNNRQDDERLPEGAELQQQHRKYQTDRQRQGLYGRAKGFRLTLGFPANGIGITRRPILLQIF